MRGLRGMSRKVLAKVSGISERYIAQLESGKGNVSIVLLRRVAQAIGAHLEDLIPTDDVVDDWPVMRDLLRNSTPAQLAQAPNVLGTRPWQTSPACAVQRHCPDRAPRRRQIDPWAHAGGQNRLAVRRTQQGDRAAERPVGRGDHCSVWSGRLPPPRTGRAEQSAGR